MKAGYWARAKTKLWPYDLCNKQKYSIEMLTGHFSLASTCYTFYISNRHYPDLMVHQILKTDMHWKIRPFKQRCRGCFLMVLLNIPLFRAENWQQGWTRNCRQQRLEYMVPFVGEVFEGSVAKYCLHHACYVCWVRKWYRWPRTISMMNDDYYFFGLKILVSLATYR